MLVLRVESEEVEELRKELGIRWNPKYDMHMTLCVKEVAAREVAAREVAVEEVAETEVVERDVAVEEVAEKEAVVKREVVVENGLVEMVRRMDIAKVDGS